MQHTYYSLFFVTIAALLSPWISIRLLKGFIPAVILEILLGFIIGPNGLSIAFTNADIDFLATFGFSYLMFLSGIELDFNLMIERKQDQRTPAWVRGALFFIVTLSISFIISYILFVAGFTNNLLIVTLILSTTSVGIVTPALKESGWISAPFGQELMLYALIADVCTLIMFTAYITFHTTGNAFSFMLIMVLLLAFVIIYRILQAARKLQVLDVVENATSEIGLRGSFALILAFLALSKTLGTEVVVGAFLAGAIISLLSDKHSLLTKKLNSIGYGFLLPIFFVNVGMKFDIQALAATPSFWLVMLVCLLGMYVNKIIPAQWFMRSFPMRMRAAGGFLLSSRLSLLIAASQIAAQSGILSKTMENGFILLAVITCFMSPILFTRSLKDTPAPAVISSSPSIIQIDKNTLPDGWVLDQITVRSSRFKEMPLGSLRLPQDVLFVSILRDEERIIPRGRTPLQQFDIIQVMGEPETLRLVKHRLEGV